MPKKALPLIEPKKLVLRQHPFDNEEYLFEVKYDGHRAVFYYERGEGLFVSREGNIMERFAGLAGAVAKELTVKDAILDGEIVALGPNGLPVFRDVTRRGSRLKYFVFDLPWINGKDLRGLPLKKRRQMLEKILPEGSALIEISIAVEGTGNDLFEKVCALDLEGIVAKRLAAPYHKRVKWYKIKNPNYSQARRRQSR